MAKVQRYSAKAGGSNAADKDDKKKKKGKDGKPNPFASAMKKAAK